MRWSEIASPPVQPSLLEHVGHGLREHDVAGGDRECVAEAGEGAGRAVDREDGGSRPDAPAVRLDRSVRAHAPDPRVLVDAHGRLERLRPQAEREPRRLDGRRACGRAGRSGRPGRRSARRPRPRSARARRPPRRARRAPPRPVPRRRPALGSSRPSPSVPRGTRRPRRCARTSRRSPGRTRSRHGRPPPPVRARSSPAGRGHPPTAS